MAPRSAPRKRGQGEGTLHQRRPGVWAGQVMLGWKSVVDPKTGAVRIRRDIRSVTRRTRQEVVQELARLRRAYLLGVLPEAGRLTLGDLLERWLSEHVAHHRARGTLDAYAKDVRLHLLPRLGRLPLQRASPLRLTEAINEFAGTGAARATIARVYAVLSSALTWGVRMHLVERHPLAGLERPRPGAPGGRVLSPRELAALLGTARHWQEGRWWPVVAVVATTGLRVGEVCALEWRDVDLSGGDGMPASLLVRGEREGARKSALAVRRVGLPALASTALCSVLPEEEEDGRGDAPVFTLIDGRRLTKDRLQRVFPELVQASGLVGRVTLKDLRHTFNQLAAVGGWDPKLRAAHLGHSPAVNQRTYTHADLTASARMADDVVGRWQDVERDQLS